MRRIKDEERKRQQDQARDNDRDELERRKAVRRQDQSEGPSVSGVVDFPSGKTLGVYSVPFGEGDYASEYSGGTVPGVDDYTNDLFQKAQHTDFEER